MQPTDQQIQFSEKISKLKDFNEAFELVKSVVLQKFKMHRAGLSLILQMMPSNLGAYHILGSNVIVMNSYLLAAVKKITSSENEYNSYVFMVLAHEYLHSLGIVNENTVRQMTFELCSWMLGSHHAATKMAKEDPSSLYPQLRSLMQTQFSQDFQLVGNFDKTNQTYIQQPENSYSLMASSFQLDAVELENRIGEIERRLAKLEKMLPKESHRMTNSDELERKLVEKAGTMNTQEMVVISLRLNGKQTKEQVKSMLQDWGKVYGNWFDGGNFNGRLVRKNIVKKEDKNEKNEDLFTLTMRGEMLADELITKVNVAQ